MKVTSLNGVLNDQKLSHFAKLIETPTLIIGDVHGCYRELEEMITEAKAKYGSTLRIILAGDPFDRGPNSREVFHMIQRHKLETVMGNHCDKLRRWMKGNPVHVAEGLAKTLEDFGWTQPFQPGEDAEFDALYDLLCNTPYSLEEPAFQVVHAQPAVSDSLKIRGEKRDYHGVQIRWNWWDEWAGKLTIFGHYWFEHPVVHVHNGLPTAIGIDTQCVIGGTLTGIVLPDFELLTVPSHGGYSERTKDHVILAKIEEDAWKTNWA